MEQDLVDRDFTYQVEYLHLRITENEVQGIANWIEIFVSALNEFDLPKCEKLVKLAKRHYLTPSSTAIIFFNEALLYVERQMWTEALSKFVTCLEIRRSNKDQVGISEVLIQIGYTHRQIGSYRQSRGALLEGLAIAQELREIDRISGCLRELGQLFEVQGELDAAKSIYLQSINLSNNSWGIAQSRYRLGLIDQFRGNYTAARQNYDVGRLELDRASPRQKRMEADITYYLGMSFYEQGKFKEAEDHFQMTLNILNEMNMFGVAQGRALQGLGMIYYERGDKISALDLYQKAKNIFQEFTSDEDIAGVELQKGIIELSQERVSEAIQHFKESMRISEKLNNKISVPDAHLGLGKAFSNLREYSRAFDHFNQALREYQTIGNRYKIALTFYEMGILLFEQGNPETGTYFQQALRISREIDSSPIIANCMFGLGMVHHERGDINEARDYYYPQCLSLYQKMNLRPKIAQALFQLGQLYHYREKLDEAKDQYLESVQIALSVNEQELALKVLQQLEVVALLANHYTDAHQYFEQGEKIISVTREAEQNQEKLSPSGSKYEIHIHQARGLSIGDQAQTTLTHNIPPPVDPAESPDTSK